jgi:hypothetical protein
LRARCLQGLARVDDALASLREALDVPLLTARTHYILALDDRAHAEPSRHCYERAHALAVELGDDRRAVGALLATVWFGDYWADYQGTAVANVREAARLAEGIDDADLILDVEMAAFQVSAHDDAEARRLLERLEERRDPLRLKDHCFILMRFHFDRGEFADGVAVCDRGIALAGQLGVPPVMYGSIKALSLT